MLKNNTMKKKDNIIFTANTVIKKGDPTSIKVETQKMSRAYDIGEKSGLFKVPKIIDYDEMKAMLQMEREHDEYCSDNEMTNPNANI